MNKMINDLVKEAHENSVIKGVIVMMKYEDLLALGKATAKADKKSIRFY